MISFVIFVQTFSWINKLKVNIINYCDRLKRRVDIYTFSNFDFVHFSFFNFLLFLEIAKYNTSIIQQWLMTIKMLVTQLQYE